MSSLTETRDHLLELARRGRAIAVMLPGEDEPRWFADKHAGHIPPNAKILTIQEIANYHAIANLSENQQVQ